MSVVSKTEIRENIEWVSIRWHDAPDTESRRVLLIGDSIVVGHGTLVHDLAKENFCVDFFATSKHVTDVEYMCDLEFMLRKNSYEVILFNNGLHGLDIDDDLYLPALREVLLDLQKRTPCLVWRSSTPVLGKENLSEFDPDTNPRVIRRNQDAAKIAGELELPVLDLYRHMAERKDLFCPDAVHYNDEGRQFQAGIVADFLQELMG